MPCTLGGAPVTMDRLLGLVNEGITQSADSTLPRSRSRAKNGATPACTARLMYSCSQPSMQTMTVGARGNW